MHHAISCNFPKPAHRNTAATTDSGGVLRGWPLLAYARAASSGASSFHCGGPANAHRRQCGAPPRAVA